MDKKVFLQTMISLATASLGFVAALAWNEAIKAVIKHFVQTGEGVGGLLAYAVVATVIAVAVMMWLGKLAERVGGESLIDREVDG